jgi:hypothetical protein
MTMLRQGPIPLAVHALLEPLVAALLIAAPFLFGFSGESAPTAISIVLGIMVLLVGMSTRWRISLVKVIPIPAHLIFDLATAALLVVSPFLFTFSDESAPTAFFIVLGVLELLAALGTRWYGTPADHHAGGGRRRRGRGREGDVTGSQPTA